MQINITPEDVERLVSDSLIKAGLGKAIAEGVQKTLNGYNSPIDQVLKQYVAEVAAELIRGKFNASITAAIQAEIEKKVTAEMVQNIVSVAVDKMAAAARERY